MKTARIFLKTSSVIAGLTRNLLHTTHLTKGLRVKPAMTVLWLILLMANFAFGQKDKNPQSWSREDFIKNEVNIISAYWHYFDENGKIKQDSSLFLKKQFDIHKNELLELESKSDNETLWNLIIYDTIGNVVKFSLLKNNEEFQIFDIDYEYDNLNRVIKRTKKYYLEQDTIQVFDTEINEFVYNSNNQIIEYYLTLDYYPRFLCVKSEYDALSNLTKKITFTPDNEIDATENYFYDEQNRLIKKVDSNSQFIRIVTYKYTDTGKIVTEVLHRGDPMNTISYYNNDNSIVKMCFKDAHGKDYLEYFYFYENNKLTKNIEKHSLEYIVVKTYHYNEKGFLKEEQTTINNKTKHLIRYYYE